MNYKSKVFLSSTQFGDEFKTERELIPILFKKEPLSSIFDLWKIENQASGNPIESEYIKNVGQSSLVILLIDSIIRDAVRNEIKEAKSAEIPIYSFIRDNANRSQEADLFIAEIRTFVTTTTYTSMSDLSEKIENSLLAFYLPKINAKEENEDLQKSELFDVKERSLKIALFALNKQSSKVTIEKILPLLISERLLIKNSSIDELRNNIPVQDKSLVDQALEHMKLGLDVLEKSGLYQLSAHKVDELRRIADSVDIEEVGVKKKLSKHYSSQVGLTETGFAENLEKCMSLIVYKTTSKVNDYFSSLGDSSYDAESLKRIVLDSIITCLGNADKLIEWQQIIIEILQSMDSQIVKWLNYIHRSFWFLAAIGCDGQTNSLFRENIEDYNIYFDSHIILRGMLNSGSEAQICSDIIGRGKKLNVPMFVSDPMLSEISKAFQQADRIFYSCHGDVNRIIKLLDDLNRKHDVIDAYVLQKESNPDLTWPEFLSPYYSSTNNKTLETYLSNVLNIKPTNISDFDINEWENVESIASELLGSRAKAIARIKEQSVDPETEEERQFYLRSNEAKQLELLYKLRKENGPNYWFVTYDRFICDTCVEIFKKSQNDPNYFPCFMKPNKWLEILLISDKESLSQTVYNEILMSPAMHHAVNSVEATVITEILKRNIDTKVREKSVLNNMFKEAVNRAAIIDVKDEISNGDYSSKKTENLDDVIRLVLYDRMSKYDKVFKEQNSEIERAKKERQKALDKAKYYKQQVTRLTRKKR